MIADPSIAEKAPKHRQSAGRKGLIDERLLPFERLRGGAAWQWVFSRRWVGDLRVKFRDGPQTLRPSAVDAVERLAQYILSAGRVVPQIEPIADANMARHRPFDRLPRGPAVHATDHEVRAVVDSAQRIGSRTPTDGPSIRGPRTC